MRFDRFLRLLIPERLALVAAVIAAPAAIELMCSLVGVGSLSGHFVLVFYLPMTVFGAGAGVLASIVHAFRRRRAEAFRCLADVGMGVVVTILILFGRPHAQPLVIALLAERCTPLLEAVIAHERENGLPEDFLDLPRDVRVHAQCAPNRVDLSSGERALKRFGERGFALHVGVPAFFDADELVYFATQDVAGLREHGFRGERYGAWIFINE